MQKYSSNKNIFIDSKKVTFLNDSRTKLNKVTIQNFIFLLFLIVFNFVFETDFFMLIFIIYGFSLIVFGSNFTSLLYLMFLTPLSEVIKFSNSGIYFYFLFFAGYIINTYIIRARKLSVKPLMLFIMFIIYTIVFYDFSDSDRFVSTFLTIFSFFVLIPLSQNYKNEYFNYIVGTISISFIFASILGLFRSLLPKLDVLLRVNVLWINNVRYERFLGISWDSNIYALFALLFMNLLMLSSIKNLIKVPIIIPIIVFGTLTFSKMFLLGFIFSTFMWTYVLMKRNVFKFIVYLVFATTIIIIANLLSGNAIFNVFISRFQEPSSLNSLTTGRSDILFIYIKKIFSNIELFLFGASLGNENLDGVASHNTFIQIIYTLGLTGFFILSTYFYLVKKNFNIKPILSVFNISYIPVIITIFTLVSLSMFSNHTFYVVIFLCMIALFEKKVFTNVS